MTFCLCEYSKLTDWLTVGQSTIIFQWWNLKACTFQGLMRSVFFAWFPICLTTTYFVVCRFKNHVSWPCWQNPCQAPRGHITWKISTLILVAPLSTIREMKAWASRDEPVPTCALDDLIGVTEIWSNGIQNSISQKTLQSRPRLVYLWSSQTLFEGHPQKRSPEYSSRIYLSLCPGCQRQLCDCSKTLLGHRLKPHVLVNFPALISP